MAASSTNGKIETPSARDFGLESLSIADLLGEDRRPGPSLRRCLSAIHANRRMIAIIMGGCLALGLIATVLQTDRYRATASIQINDQPQRILGNEDQTTLQPGKPSDVDRFLQTQVDLLKSRAIAERVIKMLRLEGNKRFLAAMGEPDAPQPPATMRAVTFQLLQRNLNVALPRNSRIATISFESAEPDLSARIANAFADEFVRASLDQRFNGASYARDAVGRQLAEAGIRLEQAERTLNDYARSAGLVTAAAPEADKTAPGVTMASLLQLNAAAAQAQADRIALEARVQGLESAPLLADRDAMQNPAVQALFTQRAGIEARLRDELTRHLEDHPGVMQLRVQLNVIDAQLHRAARNIRSAARAEYRAAAISERRLGARVMALKVEAFAERDRLVRYNMLAREVATSRALYDGLLQRYKELGAAAEVSATNIAIVDRAEPPNLPSSPNLAVNLAIALLSGLSLAVLVTFLRGRVGETTVPEQKDCPSPAA